MIASATTSLPAGIEGGFAGPPEQTEIDAINVGQ
ncbi:MAG: hypothetical protein JWN46_4043 [Acidimicrobiales bacterium]|nr:hypothetical protein [Acidimicrobiales bacterium]